MSKWIVLTEYKDEQYKGYFNFQPASTTRVYGVAPTQGGSTYETEVEARQAAAKMAKSTACNFYIAELIEVLPSLKRSTRRDAVHP